MMGRMGQIKTVLLPGDTERHGCHNFAVLRRLRGPVLRHLVGERIYHRIVPMGARPAVRSHADAVDARMFFLVRQEVK